MVVVRHVEGQEPVEELPQLVAAHDLRWRDGAFEFAELTQERGHDGRAPHNLRPRCEDAPAAGDEERVPVIGSKHRVTVIGSKHRVTVIGTATGAVSPPASSPGNHSLSLALR